MTEKKIFAIALGKVLKDVRKKFRKTQIEMDELVNLPNKYCGKLERCDRSNPAGFTFLRLHRGHLDMNDLFDQIDQEMKDIEEQNKE